MTLDAWLVARLAQELDRELQGARIEAIEASARDAIFYCYRRGGHIAVHARHTSGDPLVCAYECERSEKRSSAHGFLGDVAALLRGAAFGRVWALPGDRVLVAEVSSRSAFGLPSTSRLVFELQPRKSNVLVLRRSHAADRWIIVAAQKQFADGKVRSVRVGAPYEPPPPRRARLDRAQFIVAAAKLARDDLAGWQKLLSAYDPACTPALAREVILRTGGAKAFAHEALRHWEELAHEVRSALERFGAVYQWRDGERLIACHLIQLQWPPGRPQASASLNAVCAQALAAGLTPEEGDADDRLRTRLTTLLDRAKAQAQHLERVLEEARRADELRRAGEAIYANLTRIENGCSIFVDPQGLEIRLDPRLTPKENAGEFFRRYRKARSGLAAVQARLQTLRANQELWEYLLWELGRPGHGREQRDGLHAQIAAVIGLKRRPDSSAKRFGGASGVDGVASGVDLGGGAVALVGRSPKDNERVTFTLARPNDFWFHARGVPGAHVIVKSGGGELGESQIRNAAALAALHSRAAGATSVDVDYTRRKNVRRQGGGRTGLVWYDNFCTIRVKPERDGPGGP
jgi:predicted ribosome quality control (RQC) complex YloA/Tae2 family protein